MVLANRTEVDASSFERIKAVSALPKGSHIHICGICGTGMASVLQLLKSRGFFVSGSDKAFYPPMGEVVRNTADKVFESYSSGNLDPRPAFVVIGNTISRNNPEAEFVFSENIPYASMPEVFSALLITDSNTSIVVSGTHGKSTTTAAIAHLLNTAGLNPGYFVGGIPNDLPGSIRAVDQSLPIEKRFVVLEGDEYDSAFFAKWPKFHSYRPNILIITSLEFDHADIYNNIEEIELEFSRLVARVPKSGLVLVCGEDSRLVKLAMSWKNISCAIEFYGTKPDVKYQLLSRSSTKLKFRLDDKEFSLTARLSGPHNALNLLATAAVGKHLSLSNEAISKGIATYSGVLRRQQVIAETNGVTVIEDFAHHPTAVDLTLQGLRELYPNRRLIAVFEPRSNTSRRGVFQQEYAKVFTQADMVVMLEINEAPVYSAANTAVPPLNVKKIISEISDSGKKARSFENVSKLEDYLLEEVRSGDVLVLMSNGDFGGLPKSLPQKIANKAL